MAETLQRMHVAEVPVLVRYVDWKTLIEDINQALGVPVKSNVKVALILNVPDTTVQRWRAPNFVGGCRETRDIGYAYGEAVLELHRRVCGPDHTLRRIAEFKERATRASS